MNTVVVSILGVILATMLGIFIGVARLSSNWLVAKLATVYIEFFRNVPLLIQLFFWFIIILALPPVREGYVIGGGLFINNGGISMPFPNATGIGAALLWSLLAAGALVAGYAAFRLLTAREVRTGQTSYPLLGGLATAVVIGAIAWIVVSLAGSDSPFAISSPEPQGRFGRIAGGFTAPAAWWCCWWGW